MPIGTTLFLVSITCAQRAKDVAIHTMVYRLCEICFISTKKFCAYATSKLRGMRVPIFCESMGVDETLVELAAKQQLESVLLKDLKSDKFKDADSNSLRAHMRAG